jgi:hypothetical protein
MIFTMIVGALVRFYPQQSSHDLEGLAGPPAGVDSSAGRRGRSVGQ